ncbi:hypothetical protein GN156_13055 [bacterium LRH843]|nr:hypothetical protein [bacterium LRH843]
MEKKHLFFDSIISSFLVSLVVSFVALRIEMHKHTLLVIGNLSTFEWLLVFIVMFMIFFLCSSIIMAPLYYVIRKIKGGVFLKVMGFNLFGILFILLLAMLTPLSENPTNIIPFLLIFPLFTFLSEWIGKMLYKQSSPL